MRFLLAILLVCVAYFHQGCLADILDHPAPSSTDSSLETYGHEGMSSAEVAQLRTMVENVKAGSCGLGNYDLSQLTSSTDLSGQDSQVPPYTYYMNLCAGVNTPMCNAGTNGLWQNTPAICQARAGATTCGTKGQGQACWSLGVWGSNGLQWDYLNGDPSQGLTLTFTNGEDGCSPTPIRNVVVNLACGATTSTTLQPSEPSQCNWVIQGTINCAQATGGGGGGGGGGATGAAKKLSGGWIFIIILCVTSFLYVVGGCIFKNKRQGTSGMESCPNIDFWRELPGLVKDGCKFTWRKLRGLCGKGDAKYDEL